MAYDPNDALEMIKAEARDEGMDVSDDVMEARHAAARAMLAALNHAAAGFATIANNAPQDSALRLLALDNFKAAKSAIAAATAAGISPNKAEG